MRPPRRIGPQSLSSVTTAVSRNNLGEEEEERLVALFDDALATRRIRPPHDGEGEPTYTASVLMPFANIVGLRIASTKFVSSAPPRAFKAKV